MLTSTPKQSDVFSTALSQSTSRDTPRLPETENKCRTNSLFRRDSRSARQEVPRLLCNLQDPYRAHNKQSLFSIPLQMTQPHKHTPSHPNALRFILISSYHRLGYQVGNFHCIIEVKANVNTHGGILNLGTRWS